MNAASFTISTILCLASLCQDVDASQQLGGEAAIGTLDALPERPGPPTDAPVSPTVATAQPAPAWQDAPNKSPQFFASIVDRIVRQFDFDEPENQLDIPHLWVRISQDGFPMWNRVGFIPARPTAGRNVNRIYQLSTQGDSTGIRLVDGAVPALPRTDYMVTVRIRTQGLNSARGRIYLRFLDAVGDPIPASATRSEPIETGGEWSTVRVVLLGDHSQAAWISADLVLEQAELWKPAGAGTHDVSLQDFTGSVQFEDFVIWRLPRIELSITPGNVVIAPQPVRITIRVQDIAHGGLSGVMTIYDLHGEVVDSGPFAVEVNHTRQVWEAKIDRFGWYRAVLDVFEDGDLVGRSGLDFAYLAPAGTGPSRIAGGFGVIADQFKPAQAESLLAIVRPLGIDSLTLPLWPAHLPLSALMEHREALEEALMKFSRLGLNITLSMDQLPVEIALEVNQSAAGVYEALVSPDGAVWDHIELFLAAFGPRVQRWQIGPMGDSRLFDQGDLLQGAWKIHKRLAQWTIEPITVLPWRSEYELPARPDNTRRRPGNTGQSSASTTADSGPDARLEFAISLSAETSPAAVGDYVRSWRESGFDFTTAFEPLDENLFGLASTTSDLMKRVILAREAGAMRLTLPQPWRIDKTRHPRAMPTFLYPVWRTLADHLAGSVAVGRLDLDEGVVAIIFQNQAGGTIAMWTESDQRDQSEVALFLGSEQVVMTDFYGNQSPIVLEAGAHRFTVGSMPVFLDNIDVNLAMFRSAFKVEPRFIEASAAVNHHELVLFNPWPVAATGRLRIVSPRHWQFEQRVRTFTIAARETIRLPLNFRMPNNELAGKKQIEVDVQLQADGPLRLHVGSPVEIGYKRITLDVTYRIEPRSDGPGDVVITHEITNNSQEAVWLQAFTRAVGFPYQNADVSNLAPGETVYRVFRYTRAEERMSNTRLRVGLRELNGPGQLNLMVEIR